MESHRLEHRGPKTRGGPGGISAWDRLDDDEAGVLIGACGLAASAVSACGRWREIPDGGAWCPSSPLSATTLRPALHRPGLIVGPWIGCFGTRGETSVWDKRRGPGLSVSFIQPFPHPLRSCSNIKPAQWSTTLYPHRPLPPPVVAGYVLSLLFHASTPCADWIGCQSSAASDRFAALESMKRQTERSAAARASFSDQQRKPGFIGQLWHK